MHSKQEDQIIDVGDVVTCDSGVPTLPRSSKVTFQQTTSKSSDCGSDTDVTQNDDEDAITKISATPTNEGEMSVIGEVSRVDISRAPLAIPESMFYSAGASWLLNALAADDLQSLASSIGISLRGLYTEERGPSTGAALARSESGRHHVSAERLRQEIRRSLSADSAPDVVEWLRRYLTNLKSGNVTLLDGKSKADESGCEIISAFDDDEDVVDLSSFENSAPIDVDNYAPSRNRSRRYDADVVMFQPAGHHYEDEVRETFALDNKTAECSICYGEVPRREVSWHCLLLYISNSRCMQRFWTAGCFSAHTYLFAILYCVNFPN
jgi:hypothetical protein